MKEYTPVSTEYLDTVHIFETTDPDHADVFNTLAKELASNIAYLKKNGVSPELEHNVTALLVAVTLLKGSAINGTSGNVVVETFDDANSYVMVSGQYDKTSKRLYA